MLEHRLLGSILTEKVACHVFEVGDKHVNLLVREPRPLFFHVRRLALVQQRASCRRYPLAQPIGVFDSREQIRRQPVVIRLRRKESRKGCAMGSEVRDAVVASGSTTEVLSDSFVIV